MEKMGEVECALMFGARFCRTESNKWEAIAMRTTISKLATVMLLWTVVVVFSSESAMACRLLGGLKARRAARCCRPSARVTVKHTYCTPVKQAAKQAVGKGEAEATAPMVEAQAVPEAAMPEAARSLNRHSLKRRNRKPLQERQRLHRMRSRQLNRPPSRSRLRQKSPPNQSPNRSRRHRPLKSNQPSLRNLSRSRPPSRSRRSPLSQRRRRLP